MQIPSPAASPSIKDLDIPSPQASRKRQRSQSMQSDTSSSSVKRSASECPSHDSSSRSPVAQASTSFLAEKDQDIDAYMAEQGEADIPEAVLVTSADPTAPSTVLSVVETFKNQNMEVGETWYLVSREWWKRWRKSCTGEVDKEGGVNEKDVGPIDNTSLLDEYGNLKPSLIEQIDVEYLPEAAWTYLVTRYGPPIHPLPRKVIARGEQKLPVLELWPPRFRVLKLSARAAIPADEPGPLPKYMTFSSQDTVKTLCEALALALVPGNIALYRIWKIDYTDELTSVEFPYASLPLDAEILEESNKTLDEALIESGDIFVVEYKQITGWIVPAAPPPKTITGRQEVPPPLFSSDTGFFNRLGSSSTNTVATVIKPADDRGSSYLHTPLKPLAGPISSSLVASNSNKKSMEPGTLGLVNMGNTCFMNSALQCLAHTEELTEYFLTGVFQEELNPDNPLGMHGAIAESFGALLQRIWAGVSPSASYSPREFKQALQRFAPQFSGYQQHDSQELVAFLLDGLHEDLNRVLKKPYVEKPDWEGGQDLELIQLARKSWEGYMLRNDSVIVDLFQGQYQSTLVCPECHKVSITFDPFMYLTLPLPVQKKWSHTVFYIPWDLSKPHVQVPVQIGRDASFKDLRHLLGRWMGANPDNLLTLEIFNHRFYKNLDDNVQCGDMTDSDVIVCFELPCHAQQSRTYHPQPDDPLILPVYLCDVAAPSRYTTYGARSNNTPFGYPSIVVLTREQAKDTKLMYDVIVERLQRWTAHARDLYSWEMAPGSIEEVPIHINGFPPVNSITEFNENGEIITVEDISVHAEEADIVDAKSLVVEDIFSSAGEVPKKVGTKKDVFTLRVQTGHANYGAGQGFISTNQRFDDWKQRTKDADEDGLLLRAGDALFCEFDENVKAYYFGDEQSKWEHANWDTWEQFSHPEYEDAKKASAEKMNKGITLQDCLDEFTKEEQLGEDDLWYCPKCKKHQQATKKFDLWKAPDVLVVHLKRFSNSRSLRDKIDTFVDFPVEGLDLGDMVGERLVAQRLTAQGVDVRNMDLGDLDEPLIYDLYGVDEHLGGLGGGHYRAYALNHVTKKWYHFDDSYVTPARAADSVNANAYLLFYRRRSQTPLGGKTNDKVEEARRRPKKAPTPEPMIVDHQLPTPPNEATATPAKIAAKGIAEPRGAAAWIPLSGSSSADSSVPSPPPDSEELPGFDETMQGDYPLLDPLAVATQRFDFPDPTSSVSPSSSVEALPDDDTDRDLWQESDQPSEDWSDLTRNVSLTMGGIPSPLGSSGSDSMNPFSDANEQKLNDTDGDTNDTHIPEKTA